MNRNKIVVIALIILTTIIVCFQSFQNLGKEHIKIWDEARGANNAIEMLENNDYLVVRFDGNPDRWNTKTSLFIIAKVISYKIFGINEFAARFPSAFFVLLTAFLLLFFSYKYLKEFWTGALTILIMVNTSGYMGYHVARNGEPDAMLVFFVLLYALTWFILLEKYPQKRNLYYTIFGIAFVFAVYTKNIAGISPVAGIALYSLFRFNKLKSIFKDYRLYATIVLSLFTISLYYIIRDFYDPGYIKAVFEREIKGMFVDYVLGEPKHPEPTFYINNLYEKGFKNYLYFLPLGIITLFISKSKFRKRLLIFAFMMSFALLAGYSASEAKNEWYIAPIYPYLSLIIGISIFDLILYLNRIVQKKWLKYSLMIIILMPILFTLFGRGKKVYKRNQPKKQFIYKPERPGYYLKKYIHSYPNIKQYYVLTSLKKKPQLPDQDQLKFYAKKHKFLNNIETIVLQSMDSSLSDVYVYSCEKQFIQQIKKKYNYSIIEEDKYATLFKIKNYLGDRIHITFSYGNSWSPIENKTKFITLPDSIDIKNTIGFAAASYSDTCFLWMNDYSGFIIEQNKNKLTPFRYKLPHNYKPGDIITMAYDSNNKTVYAYCSDMTIITGIYSEIDKEIFLHPSDDGSTELPIHMAILNKNDTGVLYVWYKNNKLHKIKLSNLPYLNKGKIISEGEYKISNYSNEMNIIDIAIGGDNKNVYTLFY